ncbi:MAG TPA: SDR family oxidoreductase [Aquabacterium sp.]|nr:SDR family oxidoreductase [Aquabacterium sp.]
MKTPNQTHGVVLITGCASGIGRALAQAFHARGLRVCATARRVDALADLKAADILTLPLDVTNPSDFEAVQATLAAQGLHIDILVNNAGYGAMGPLLDMPAQAWQKQFDVNVFAPVSLIRAVLPDMIERRQGLIVNISSVSGVLPTPFASAYCASKAAMNALSDTLRMEVAPFGIRVVTVQPGGIQSGFGDAAAQATELSPGSPYQRVRDAIYARARGSQDNATPADAFAERMVEQVLRLHCPAVLRIGQKSRLMPAIKRWLPEAWIDRMLSKKFDLDRVSHG